MTIEASRAFIADINPSAMESVVFAARHNFDNTTITCSVNPTYIGGSFNIVFYATFADGLCWVLRLPILAWSALLERRLGADIAAMQLIQTHTTIPIPVIYGYDLTQGNPLGRPYVIMSRLSGTRLGDLWFREGWFNFEKRTNIFRSLAKNLSQLKNLEFPAIGSLQHDPDTGKCIVGSPLPSRNDFQDIKSHQYRARDPYKSAHVYILDQIEEQAQTAQTNDHRASLALLRMFAGFLLDHTIDGPPYVLAVPDFNFQNILVDDDRNITGIIDWDDMNTVPRQGGYASYPAWITRDWDPLMYTYNPDFGKEDQAKTAPELREQQQEDSPSELAQFRTEYLAIYSDIDPVGARFTRHSHIFEAIQIAIDLPYLRGHIVDKLARYVFGEGADPGSELCSYGLERGIAQGEWLDELDSRFD